VRAESFELCLAFLLSAAVGYSIRAAISRSTTSKARQRREEELVRRAHKQMRVDATKGGRGAIKVRVLGRRAAQARNLRQISASFRKVS
jgi:hypothetical protein